MKAMLIGNLVSTFCAMLSPDLIKKFLDGMLDFAEEYVLGSASKIDDAAILPICKMIRMTFDIPDND